MSESGKGLETGFPVAKDDLELLMGSPHLPLLGFYKHDKFMFLKKSKRSAKNQ